MGSRKQDRPSPSRNSRQNPRSTATLFKKKTKKKQQQKEQPHGVRDGGVDTPVDNRSIYDGRAEEQPVHSRSQKLAFFLGQYQSANSIRLSSLELESINDKCVLDLHEGVDTDVKTVGKKIKAAFGVSWKESLCDNSLMEGKINPGSPVVLVIAASAIRVLQMLKGFKSFTRECQVAKLFSKHIKIDEQVTLLKNRVNIAGGTPSRIKKLIDMEVLGISRLSVVLLDICPDVKGYSLLTLPQVKDEFWDLYKNYFHHRVVERDLRICLYGPLMSSKHAGKSGSHNE